jgi:hypothetical protein
MYGCKLLIYITSAPGTPKECLPYYNEFMTQMGDCLLPLQLIRFNNNEYKVVEQKGSGTKSDLQLGRQWRDYLPNHRLSFVDSQIRFKN